MAVNPSEILERLIERNPGLDQEELAAAFKEAAKENPALREAIVREYAVKMYPLAKKIANGEPLTEAEQRLVDFGK